MMRHRQQGDTLVAKRSVRRGKNSRLWVGKTLSPPKTTVCRCPHTHARTFPHTHAFTIYYKHT